MFTRFPERRVLHEMKQFDDKAYASEFKLVEHIGHNKVKVIMNDGSKYIIERSDNFFEPPNIYAVNDDVKNRKMKECSIEFNPSYTCTKWILMMHCLL